VTETTTDKNDAPPPTAGRSLRDRFEVVYEAIDKVTTYAASLGINEVAELILLFGGGIIRAVASLDRNSPIRAAAAKSVEHLVGRLGDKTAHLEPSAEEQADKIEEQAEKDGAARGMDPPRIKKARRRVESAARTLRYIGSVEGVDDDQAGRALVLAGAMALLYKHCPIEETPRMRTIVTDMLSAFDDVDQTNKILQDAAEQFASVAEQLWDDLLAGEKKAAAADSDPATPPASAS